MNECNTASTLWCCRSTRVDWTSLANFLPTLFHFHCSILKSIQTIFGLSAILDNMGHLWNACSIQKINSGSRCDFRITNYESVRHTHKCRHFSHALWLPQSIHHVEAHAQTTRLRLYTSKGRYKVREMYILISQGMAYNVGASLLQRNKWLTGEVHAESIDWINCCKILSSNSVVHRHLFAFNITRSHLSIANHASGKRNWGDGVTMQAHEYL